MHFAMADEKAKGIGLVEFIQAVKQELVRAQQSAGSNPLLKLDDVELEMSVVTTKEASGGLKFWVIELGGKYDKEQTHKLTVKLAPISTTVVGMVAQP